jgi:hypothetical protein
METLQELDVGPDYIICAFKQGKWYCTNRRNDGNIFVCSATEPVPKLFLSFQAYVTSDQSNFIFRLHGWSTSSIPTHHDVLTALWGDVIITVHFIGDDRIVDVSRPTGLYLLAMWQQYGIYSTYGSIFLQELENLDGMLIRLNGKQSTYASFPGLSLISCTQTKLMSTLRGVAQLFSNGHISIVDTAPNAEHNTYFVLVDDNTYLMIQYSDDYDEAMTLTLKYLNGIVVREKSISSIDWNNQFHPWLFFVYDSKLYFASATKTSSVCLP